MMKDNEALEDAVVKESPAPKDAARTKDRSALVLNAIFFMTVVNAFQNAKTSEDLGSGRLLLSLLTDGVAVSQLFLFFWFFVSIFRFWQGRARALNHIFYAVIGFVGLAFFFEVLQSL